MEQCLREHYAEKLDEQRAEGCRIQGGLRVNKVVGNFHLAPGRSFSNGNMHVHDLKNYWDSPLGHSFTHTIHSLRFGPQLPDDVGKKLGSKTMPWTNHHSNPLDGTKQETDDPNFNYMYFLKIVPTSYLPLGWEKGFNGFRDDHSAEIGAFGQGSDGSVETHQYSVTSHRRSLAGGTDAAEGHEERLHAKGGIPGVFFSYVSFLCPLLRSLRNKGHPASRNEKLILSLQDISPMKVVNREERPKTFLGFVAGLCAIIGGTLTVAAAVDRGLFEGATRLKKLRAKDM